MQNRPGDRLPQRSPHPNPVQRSGAPEPGGEPGYRGDLVDRSIEVGWVTTKNLELIFLSESMIELRNLIRLIV